MRALHACLGIVSIAGLWVLAEKATADVVTIGSVKDATLFSEGDLLANGSGANFFAGNTDGGNTRRSVLEFDVAGSVPIGATINSVTLQLTVNRSQQAGTRSVDLHRILTPWSE